VSATSIYQLPLPLPLSLALDHLGLTGTPIASDPAYERFGPSLFNQTTDHGQPPAFTIPGVDEYFQQRYWVNDEFYQQGGPVIVLLSGEGDATLMLDALDHGL